ncbi:glycoside hydrolase [Aureobasidium sp. EXF-12298]|nr:glycoside hydrolase [Aureobasidium sp. EXF-12298]
MRSSTVATAALIAGSSQVQAAPTFGLVFGLIKGITTSVHTDLNALLGSVGVGLQTNANVHGQALGFGGVGCPFSLGSQAGVSVNAGLHGGLSHNIGWSAGAGVNAGAFINWRSFKANGVTLSGWLVQDKSLDLDWWNKYGSDCNDEWSLTAKLGAKAGAVLEARYSSYITTSYIDSLAAAGINLLRIPTHYSAWVSVPGSGLYSGNQQAHLKAICDYAIQRHGMHIVIGLDSLPGGVNGLSSGERIGATGWFNSAENLSYSFKAIDAILGFISASGRVNAFTISPINEPCDVTANFATTGGLSLGATNFITTYVQGVMKKIAKLDARIPCMVQDAFLGHDYWSPLFSANANIVIDSHVSFSGAIGAGISAGIGAGVNANVAAGANVGANVGAGVNAGANVGAGVNAGAHVGGGLLGGLGLGGLLGGHVGAGAAVNSGVNTGINAGANVAAGVNTGANTGVNAGVNAGANAGASNYGTGAKAGVSVSAAPKLSAHLIAPSVCKQATLLKGSGKFPVFVGSYGIQAQEGNTLSGRKTIYNTQKYAYAQNLSGGCFSHAKAYSNSVAVSGEGCASDYNSFQSLMTANVATKNTESCYC